MKNTGLQDAMRKSWEKAEIDTVVFTGLETLIAALSLDYPVVLKALFELEEEK